MRRERFGILGTSPWIWDFREGTFGKRSGRRIHACLWQTECWKEFQAPLRIYYYGKRYNWHLGAAMIQWSWKRNTYKDEKYRHFTFEPANHRERWQKAYPEEVAAMRAALAERRKNPPKRPDPWKPGDPTSFTLPE